MARNYFTKNSNSTWNNFHVLDEKSKQNLSLLREQNEHHSNFHVLKSTVIENYKRSLNVQKHTRSYGHLGSGGLLNNY